FLEPWRLGVRSSCEIRISRKGAKKERQGAKVENTLSSILLCALVWPLAPLREIFSSGSRAESHHGSSGSFPSSGADRPAAPDGSRLGLGPHAGADLPEPV